MNHFTVVGDNDITVGALYHFFMVIPISSFLSFIADVIGMYYVLPFGVTKKRLLLREGVGATTYRVAQRMPQPMVTGRANQERAKAATPMDPNMVVLKAKVMSPPPTKRSAVKATQFIKARLH